MKEEVKVGDEFSVDFMKNNKGGKPVGRINGMVCFIDRSTKDFVTPTSTWMCAVTSIQDNYLVIKPLYRLRTAKDNEILVEAKIAALVATHSTNKHNKKDKIFNSFDQLLSNE